MKKLLLLFFPLLFLAGCAGDYSAYTPEKVFNQPVISDGSAEVRNVAPVKEKQKLAPSQSLKTKTATKDLSSAKEELKPATLTTQEIKPVVEENVNQPVAVPLSNDNNYINTDGKTVHSPAYAPSVPAGATAICRDGTYSFSQHRSGTCSHHGGVSKWL